MESSTSDKIIHIAMVALFILVVVLSTALYIQGKQLSKLKEDLPLNNISDESVSSSELLSHPAAEIKAQKNSSDQSLSKEDEEAYKNKIKKLESQIAEMQEWSDFLEESMDEYEEKADAAVAKSPRRNSMPQADMDRIMRRSYLSRYEDFIKENNYPPEVMEKLADLYIERQNAMRERMPDMGGFGPGERSREEIEKLTKISREISDEYEEKLTELLTEEGREALREYEQKSMERSFLSEFKKMLGDEKLEKSQESKLLSLMYDERQASNEEMRKKAMSYAANGQLPDKETIAEMQKESLTRMKAVYEKYAASAEGILSDSQIQKFEGYVNMRKQSLESSLSSSHIFITDNEKEKDDE